MRRTTHDTEAKGLSGRKRKPPGASARFACRELTLQLSSVYRTWSGVVCALHCRTSERNRNWKKAQPLASSEQTTVTLTSHRLSAVRVAQNSPLSHRGMRTSLSNKIGRLSQAYGVFPGRLGMHCTRSGRASDREVA